MTGTLFNDSINNMARRTMRVPFAFGSNYECLLALKRKYDPDDVLRGVSILGIQADQIEWVRFYMEPV
jgi:hypothetical protein